MDVFLIHWASWICRFTSFTKFWKCSASSFLFLFVTEHFFLSEIVKTRMWEHSIWPQRSLKFISFFSIFFFSILFKLDNFHYIHLQIHSFLSRFHLSVESNQRPYSSYYTVKLKYFYWLPILGTSSMIFLLFHSFQKGHITYWSIFVIRSDQIRSVAQSCPTLCDPMNRSTPGLPIHHQLPEFTETHVHQVSDAITAF